MKFSNISFAIAIVTLLLFIKIFDDFDFVCFTQWHPAHGVHDNKLARVIVINNDAGMKSVVTCVRERNNIAFIDFCLCVIRIDTGKLTNGIFDYPKFRNFRSPYLRI